MTHYRYDDQPDTGGNRHYDYISVEEYDAAKESLKEKTRWMDLTTHEIVVLRSMARRLGIAKDAVDHSDRLALIRCLFGHCENRDEWMGRERAARASHMSGEATP